MKKAEQPQVNMPINIIRKLQTNMSVNIIGTIILVLFIFGAVVSTIGYIGFTISFKSEYSQTTFHMADTAATLVNGDKLEDYLRSGEDNDYRRTKRLLDAYCNKMEVSLVYVIVVDRSDYGRFVSVFNAVDNEVDNTNYKEWELGHQRDTTNLTYNRNITVMKVGRAKEALRENTYKPSQWNIAYNYYPFIRTIYAICIDPRSTGVARAFKNFCWLPNGDCGGTASQKEDRRSHRHRFGGNQPLCPRKYRG